MVVGALVLVAGFAVALVLSISAMVRNSEPYAEAMLRIANNAEAVARLGAPIVANGMPGGNLSISEDGGDVALRIPVRGPKGEGVLVVTGIRERGNWRYSRVELHASEGEPVDLRTADERTGAWPL